MFVPTGRMDNDVGLFVDDDEVLVLEDDVEGDVLGRDLLGFGLGQDQLDGFTRIELVTGLDLLAIDLDVSAADGILHEPPAEIAEPPVQVFI